MRLWAPLLGTEACLCCRPGSECGRSEWWEWASRFSPGPGAWAQCHRLGLSLGGPRRPAGPFLPFVGVTEVSKHQPTAVSRTHEHGLKFTNLPPSPVSEVSAPRRLPPTGWLGLQRELGRSSCLPGRLTLNPSLFSLLSSLGWMTPDKFSLEATFPATPTAGAKRSSAFQTPTVASMALSQILIYRHVGEQGVCTHLSGTFRSWNAIKESPRVTANLSQPSATLCGPQGR